MEKMAEAAEGPDITVAQARETPRLHLHLKETTEVLATI
jgi:hypothetical protein